MFEALELYQKKKDYLICVDSDGCAMNTMDIKHFRCFGPKLVEVWNLYDYKDEILQHWNIINLYSMTRGVNRFKGLVMELTHINEEYTLVEGLEALRQWTETTSELSNAALEREIKQKKQEDICLVMALNWSQKVNEAIGQLDPKENLPFKGVLEGLRKAHEYADVAIVSSANADAVIEEWQRCKLLDQTDIMLAQNVGTKSYCIAQLLKKGYDKDHVLMVGDAPGDLDAARQNGVLYYPILVKKEDESWRLFQESILEQFLQGNYKSNLEQQYISEFNNNLV